MNKRQVFSVGLVLLVVAMLLAASTTALALHPGGDVTVRDSAGNPITNGTTPYSPKMTCGACHNYGLGESHSTHVQGVLGADGAIYWQANDVKSFANGASTSYHMNQGRNEDYSNNSRKTYNDPFFTSSPGMFGKY